MLDNHPPSTVHRQIIASDNSWYVSFRKLSRNNYRHLHGSIELLYLQSGRRTFFLDNRTEEIVPGKLLIINSNVMHKAINPPDIDCEGILVYIHQFPHELQRVKTVPQDGGYRDVFRFERNGSRGETGFHREITDAFPGLFSCPYRIICFDNTQRSIFEAVLAKIRKEMTEEMEGQEFAVKSQLTTMLVQAGRALSSEQAVSPGSGETDDRLSNIMEYIATHYMEDLSLQSIADIFHLSPVYFSRYFRKHSGFSFVEFINTARIREALRMIQEGQHTMAFIADSVGFGSVSHFGRVFRQVTGRTPSSFRHGGICS